MDADKKGAEFDAGEEKGRFEALEKEFQDVRPVPLIFPPIPVFLFFCVFFASLALGAASLIAGTRWRKQYHVALGIK